jgi:biotin carboxylase
MKKKVLILGTLHGQNEAIVHLQGKGVTVYACGHKAEGPGVQTADEFFLADILDPSAIASLAARLKVDCVYSVGSEMAMPTIAAVSARLGLPHFHSEAVTETLYRKNLLREFLGRINLSPVAYRHLASEGDLAGFSAFPAIIKPTDSQGQRGISRVATAAEAPQALAFALANSKTRKAIIEEWLEGPEFSVHVFVVEGRVEFFLPSDRIVWQGPLIGIPQAHAMPCRALDPATETVVRGMVDRFVQALPVRTGPLYFQMKRTPGGPRIIEVASRLDGCHLWRLVEFHTGFNLLDACFDYLLEGRWTPPAPQRGGPGHTLHFQLADPTQPFHARNHPLPAGRKILFHEYQVDEGQCPRSINDVVARVGYYIEET